MGTDPFPALPYEIVAHILSFVPRHDLPTVCLVNQSLCRCAEPILCSDITLEWTHQKKTPPIIPLLQKLFRRPELFDSIDVVSLTGDDFVGHDPSPPLTATESIGVEFEHIIKSFNTPFTNYWVKKLREGSMDAFAALLIAHLSKIRRLTITYNYIRRLDLIGKVLQSKSFGQHLPRFERLKLIIYFQGFDYWAPPPPHRFDEVMSLFHIPTVTHLAAHIGSAELFYWPAGEPDLSCLTSLDLEGCCTEFMSKILALTRSLKSLSWRWEYAPETDNPWITTNLDLDEIISALSYIRDTLEKLQFRITINSGFRLEAERTMDVSGSFSGLVNFNRLTEIEVPLACLADFGAQPQPLDRHVPRSVETLCLSTGMLYNEAVQWIPDDEWPTDQDVVQLLQQLAKSYPARLPRLRLVKIIDTIFCFENRQLDEMLASNSLGIDIEIVRSVAPLWDLSVNSL